MSFEVGRSKDCRFVPKDGNLNLRTRDINSKRKYLTQKPDFTLRLDDIEGARPKPKHYNLGKRCVNPLDPVYDLPKFTPPPIPSTKFLRDNIQIKDIEYAQPTPLPRKIRENNHGQKLIERAKSRSYERRPECMLNSLRVRDINRDPIGRSVFRTNRNPTNPNQPQYSWDLNHAKIPQGHIYGSTSTKLIRNLKKTKDFNLRTTDILGAQVQKEQWKRNYNRDFNRTQDIFGAQASTKKRFRTRRCVNPIQPKYKRLDTPPQSPVKE